MAIKQLLRYFSPAIPRMVRNQLYSVFRKALLCFLCNPFACMAFVLVVQAFDQTASWTPLWYSGNMQLVERPWGRPRTRWRDIYPVCPGNASGSPGRSWRTWLGKRTSELLFLVCCTAAPWPGVDSWREGWMDGWFVLDELLFWTTAAWIIPSVLYNEHSRLVFCFYDRVFQCHNIKHEHHPRYEYPPWWGNIQPQCHPVSEPK